VLSRFCWAPDDETARRAQRWWVDAGVCGGLEGRSCRGRCEPSFAHGEKAAAIALSLDAFDTASNQVTERYYTSFAEGFAKEFTQDEASGELRSGGEDLTNNFDLVDKFTASTGAVATIFARKDDDFVRIATSLKKPDGERAVGTSLGPPHPARAAMLAGKLYTGRAVLFGKHYMTRYQPVNDAAGKVVGILFIGFDLFAFQGTLETMVAQTRLQDSGGLMIIDPKQAAGEAVFIAHPSAKGIQQARDSSRPPAGPSPAADDWESF
jgi:methyl-accepting chemotaxis protein